MQPTLTKYRKGISMAAGTRTAPTVNGTPSSKILSYSVIDAQGDVRTESFVVPGTATPAQIEALIAAIAADSVASLFEVKVQEVYSGQKGKQNATLDGRESADDKVYITVRDAALRLTRRLYVPAPIAGLFVADSETINTGATLFTDLTTALTPLLGTFLFSTVSFVEHQESNTPQQL